MWTICILARDILSIEMEGKNAYSRSRIMRALSNTEGINERPKQMLLSELRKHVKLNFAHYLQNWYKSSFA